MMKIFLSILLISIAGIFIIPNAFANEFGTISVEKSVYEVVSDRSVLVKLYGTVENPKQGDRVEFVITNPDGSTSNLKSPKTSTGYYETYVNVEYANLGNYSVSAQFNGNSIGSVTFEVAKAGTAAAAERAAAEKAAAERAAAERAAAERAAAEKAAAEKAAAEKAAADKEPIETQTQTMSGFTTSREDLAAQMGMDKGGPVNEQQSWAMLQYAKETGQYVDPFQQSINRQKAAAQQAWENKPFFEKYTWITPLLMWAAIIAGIVGTVVTIRKRMKSRKVIRVAQQQSRTRVRTKQTFAFCDNCGNPLKPHYKFCNSCGNKV